MRLAIAVFFAGLTGFAGCDKLAGPGEETEYQGALSGQFSQNTNHGNGVVCTSTHAVSGQVSVKMRQEGQTLRGQTEVYFEAPPIAVAGDTAFCRISGTPPVTSSWGKTEVSGTANDLRLSDSHSESTAESSSNETLSFNGRVTNDVLTGTLMFNRTSQRTIVQCDNLGCWPPRTVTSNISWTTNVSATQR